MRAFTTVTVIALGAAAATAQATAQATTPATKYSSELDMRIDPNSVPAKERAMWCLAQTNTCGQLCENNTSKNSCIQESIKYECVCAANNSAPALQYYTQTIPTFVCETLFSQCNSQNVGNADGQQSCINDIQNLCGKAAPPKAASSGGSSGGDGGDSSDSSSSTAASSSSQPTASQPGNNNAVTTTRSGGLAPPTKAPAANGVAFAAALGFLAVAL